MLQIFCNIINQTNITKCGVRNLRLLVCFRKSNIYFKFFYRRKLQFPLQWDFSLKSQIKGKMSRQAVTWSSKVTPTTPSYWCTQISTQPRNWEYKKQTVNGLCSYPYKSSVSSRILKNLHMKNLAIQKCNMFHHWHPIILPSCSPAPTLSGGACGICWCGLSTLPWCHNSSTSATMWPSTSLPPSVFLCCPYSRPSIATHLASMALVSSGE